MVPVKTPAIFRLLYSNLCWRIPNKEMNVFLTFDDGPHPTETPFVLNLLDQYNMKATFFCVGENIDKYPEVFQDIIDRGHAIGNHTYHHSMGWKVSSDEYLADKDAWEQAAKEFNFNRTLKLFRPPYGRITRNQISALKQQDYKIIMWDVLTKDYLSEFSPEECAKSVLENTEEGSIVVFHDSNRASERLRYVLPQLLDLLSKRNLKSVNLWT